ncbi:hypothetical protein BGZ70_004285 [Mortierella alpina]|uniref:Uncharacterized protein n=1 Tax=Mortierella alpina TaxID=64518 RepID=A0A9P6JA46_MORAP|nr:hypothetical protein BGZ70_004285 [Mortierella alpina]
MDHGNIVALNHISVIIPEARSSVDQGSSLSATDEQYEETANEHLACSSDPTSNGKSDVKTQAAVPEIAVVSKSSIARRWYFKTDSTTDVHEDERRFLSTTCQGGSVHQVYQQEGLYDIILGLSSDALNVDLIETLTLRIAGDRGHSIAPSELIRKQDLKAMCGHAKGLVKWGFDLQLAPSKFCNSFIIEMEFRQSEEGSSTVEPGHLDLHFMELHASVNKHFGRGDDPVSGKNLILQLWDITSSNDVGIDGTTDAGTSAGNNPHANAPPQNPFKLSRSCGILQTVYQPDILDLVMYTVSVSWDGSQVALLDSMIASHHKSLFAVYRHDHSRHLESKSPSGLTHSTDYQHCTELNNFVGCGKFHVTTTSSQETLKEVFVAYTDRTIHIFNVAQKWALLRTIPLNIVMTWRLCCYGRFSAGCVGKRLAWSNGDNTSTWDMERGTLISLSVVKDRRSARLGELNTLASREASHAISDDGTMLALLCNSVLSVSEISSGTEVQSAKLPEGYSVNDEVWFIRNDTQLLVQTSRSDASYNRGRHALILNVNGLVITDRILMPAAYIDVVKSPGADDQFYAYHGSRLRRIRLEDCIIQPYSRLNRHSCDSTCSDNLVDFTTLHTEYTAENGLQFKAILQNVDGDDVVVVKVTSVDGVKACKRLFTVDRSKVSKGVFLDKLHRLLVVSPLSIVVWSLPKTVDGELNLIYCGNIMDGSWRLCPHQQLYWSDKMVTDSPSSACI